MPLYTFQKYCCLYTTQFEIQILPYLHSRWKTNIIVFTLAFIETQILTYLQVLTLTNKIICIFNKKKFLQPTLHLPPKKSNGRP